MGKFCAAGGGSEPIRLDFSVEEPPKKSLVIRSIRRVVGLDVNVDADRYDEGELVLTKANSTSSYNALPRALAIATRFILAAM